MLLNYTASESDAGRKVYHVMRRELMISDTLTRRLKQAGAIFADGMPVFTDRRLAAGETLSVDIAAAEPVCDIVPEQGSLEILYEDSGLVAVNKLPGVLTHPSHARYTGTLSNFVAGYLLEKTGDGRCHAVNRLDRDTSGVVLFAKNSYMKARAIEALAAADAVKEYLALVAGAMEESSGTVDLPIRRLKEGDMLRVVAPDGQRAVTRYETISVKRFGGDAVSVLRLRLETGRTHQIRVHCLALGHPVLGDSLYASDASRALSARLGIATQALRACTLTFTEPISHQKLLLTADPPEWFDASLPR
jgi:23S rRNA pseudouridine1911/1915/1917 synthase